MSWKTVLTLCSGDIIDIYSTQPHAKHHAHVNRHCLDIVSLNQIYLKPVIASVGISNWDNRANQVKSFVTFPWIIKGKGPKDDANELLHLSSINYDFAQ